MIWEGLINVDTQPVSGLENFRLRCNAVRHGLTAETVIGALEELNITKPSRQRSLRIMMLHWRSSANLCCD
jgi:hypothetical protein